MGLADLSAQMQKDRAGRKNRGTTGAKGHNEGGEEVRGDPDPAWQEHHAHMAEAHRTRSSLHADAAAAHESLAKHHEQEAAYHDACAQRYVGDKGRNS